VVVRRPVAEVVESLTAFGFDPALTGPSMRRLDAKLDQVVKRTGALEVTFDALNEEATCRAVWEHCLPYPFDHAHWQRLAGENVQCDMLALVRYAVAFREQLGKLTAQARHAEIRELTTRKPVEPAGITFQTEDCETWRRDGRKLFEDHCMVVGEDPREWETKNWPLFKAIEDAGAMQITTARSNGRMFGYLMTLVAPSLVSDKTLSATHTTFYADPSFPGLGMKLQREALARLKARGVDEVVWEAGNRGDGPRLGTMYRRLGATEHGRTYRLELTEH
jgi:GNAT superfamily N-acetyltransferase